MITHPASASIKKIKWVAKLMDSQFTLPGTKIKFGLDPLIGLIPGVGDFATFLVSGMMVSVLAKNGASGFVLARMVVNIILDALVGSIPVVGDAFDFVFRANEKNLKLMEEHYLEGRHNGSALKVIIPLLLFLFIVIAIIAWLGFKIITWLIHLYHSS